MTAYEITTAFHIITGSAALCLGIFPLIATKGGQVHRRTGRIFIAFAAINLGAAIIADIFYNPPVPLIAATLAAAYQYVSSLRALALNKRGPGWPDALLALAALMIGGLLLGIVDRSSATWPPALGYSSIGFTILVALYDLSRHLWRGMWLAKARPLDHGLKMTGAYFAMMSAGFGNLFVAFQPFSQFGPSLLGLAVMVLFALRYRRVTLLRPANS